MDNQPSHLSGEPSQAKVFVGIFCFSLLLLAVGPYTNVSQVATLDPWIYTGYFQNFSEMVERYGRTYYVARLPYILPGIGLYKVFAPPVANWVLNALLLTGILGPLYLIAVRHFQRQVAPVILAAAAASTYLASTIIWDYPDGPAITYTMMGLWFCLAAPTGLSNRTALLLAGAMWMMAGITNFICVFILIGLGLMVALWRNRGLKDTLLDLGLGVLGALLCLGVWCMISKLTIDTWNILGPQWNQVRYATDNKDYLPNMWGRGNAWISRTYRQLPTLALHVLASLLLLRPGMQGKRWRDPLGAALAGLAVSFALFAWLEFGLDKIVLRVFYHSSYLIAPVLLAALALVGSLYRESLPKSGRLALTVLLCLAFALPAISRGYWGVPRLPLPWLAATLVGSFLILVPPAWRAGRLAVGCGLVSLGGLINLGTAVDPTITAMTLQPKEALFVPDSSAKINARKAAYQLEVATDLQIFLKNGGLRRNALHFWYDPDDSAKRLFDSLYSLYLWGYRDLTAEFQSKSLEEMRGFLGDNGRVLHLSSDPDRIAAHRKLMESRGVRWREIGSWNLGQRGPRYRIALDEVTFP